MFSNLIQDKATKIFLVIALLLFSLMLVMENINGRFQLNDLKVMYMAAEAYLNDSPIYGVTFGLSTGYYKYSPFTLFLFVPYNFLPYHIASIVHFIIVATSAISAIILMPKLVNKHLFNINPKLLLFYILTLIGVLNHILKDLHLGNINSIIILLLVLSFLKIAENKHLLAGLFIALVIITKPYFFIILFPLFLYKKYKTIAFTGAWGVAFVLSTVIIMGFSTSLDLHLQWIAAMLDHSELLGSYNTFISLSNYYLGTSIPSMFYYPLFLIIGIATYLFFYFDHRKLEVAPSTALTNRNFTFYFFLIIAIIPNALITDNEHFIFSLPLIAMSLLWLIETKKIGLSILFAVMIVLYGGNTMELLGRDLMMKVNYWGILGIANIMILGFSSYVFFAHRKQWKTIEK